MTGLNDYKQASDSKSLTHIGDKPFTIVDVEDSEYTGGDAPVPGVKITTKESFDVEGESYNKFHTSRVAIVSKLSSGDLRNDIKAGTFDTPVKCVKVKGKNGKDYFDLVDA